MKIDYTNMLTFVKSVIFYYKQSVPIAAGVGHDVIKFLNFSAIQCEFNRGLILYLQATVPNITFPNPFTLVEVRV